MDKQREEFEEAFKNNNAYNIELIHGTNTPTFEQNSKGEYLKISVQNHWEMWQQAQKVAVPEGYVLVEKSKIESLSDYAYEAKQHSADSFAEIKYIEQELQAMIEAQEN